eukprot:2422296-Alexandrium_andersonii.AAC.1
MARPEGRRPGAPSACACRSALRAVCGALQLPFDHALRRQSWRWPPIPHHASILRTATRALNASCPWPAAHCAQGGAGGSSNVNGSMAAMAPLAAVSRGLHPRRLPIRPPLQPAPPTPSRMRPR